jgi:hypothetical protein
VRSRRKFFACGLILFSGVAVLVGTWIWYGNKYVHQHCIVQAPLALKLYSSEHAGKFPTSTNGFGDALLMLARFDPTTLNCICGPDDDGHLFKEALLNNTIVPEEKCSRVYVQGLTEADNPEICILFDRNSCRGGDHFRSPWGHPLREVVLADGSWRQVRDEDWPEFSRKQVGLLVAEGFSKTDALRFYPAAK